jgi:hypothetical protein
MRFDKGCAGQQREWMHEQDGQGREARGLRRYWHYLFALAFALAYHHPLLVPAWGMPNWGDYYNYHTPNRMLESLRLGRGELPMWTDALYCGYPILADPQAAFFHPVNLLWAMLVQNPGTQQMMNLYQLVSVVSLALGTTFLARRCGLGRAGAVVASLIASYNGFIAAHLDHVNINQALAPGLVCIGCMVRVARGVDARRRMRLAVVAGLAMAVAILAGHPQTVLFVTYAAVVALAYYIVRYARQESGRGAIGRLLMYSTVAVVIAGGASVVQMLPTAELLKVCTRMSMHAGEALGSGARPDQVPMLLFPGFYRVLPWHFTGDKFHYNTGPNWLGYDAPENTSWMGVAAFAMGLAGWLVYRRRAWANVLFFGALFLLVCAWGQYARVYMLLYNWVPGFRAVRISSRLLSLAYTAWALLAGSFVDAVVAEFNRQGLRRSSRLAAVAVFGVLVVGIGGALIARHYGGSWTATTRMLFIRYEGLKSVGTSAANAFDLSIFFQAVLAVLVCLGVAALMWTLGSARGRLQLGALVLLCGILVFELVVYGFGISYVELKAPWTRVRLTQLDALGKRPVGRMATTHAIMGGGATNVAMCEPNVRLATGYSVTVPEWAGDLLPLDGRTWRPGIEGKLLDLCNVTDVVNFRRTARGTLGGRNVPLEDWGYCMLTRDDERVSSSVTLQSTTSAPIRLLRVVCAGTSTTNLLDGTEIGRVTLITSGTRETTSVALRLGEHLSDWMYDMWPAENDPIRHSAGARSWRRSLGNIDVPDGLTFYDAAIPLDPPRPISEVTISASGPTSTSLAVSHVIMETRRASTLLLPSSIEGCEEAPSLAQRWHHWVRPGAPGYAWIAPAAEPISYKRTVYAFNRVTSAAFDLRRQILVDKQRYTSEALAQLNAPDPAEFRGTAEMEWGSAPEQFNIRTRSNQRGWAYVTSTWYPGWTARLDGVPVEIVRANSGFSAVAVPAGEHRIEFSFAYRHFRLAAWISALTWVASLGVLLMLCFRGRARISHARIS